MQSHHCLNCAEETTKHFCANCGQKTNTHRIEIKHFVMHDILHGVWHFEKGILFTLKEAIIRPGKAALDYISGKRIRYYNVFYLTLLLIGLNIYIRHIQNELSHYYFNTNLEPETEYTGKNIDDFLSYYAKFVVFSFIPLFAINSLIIFKRKKLNFSEHFILSGMIFLGVMIITTISTLLFFTDYLKYFDVIGSILNFATPFSILVYLTINYYKTFSENYSTLQNSIRVFLFIVLLLLEILFLATLIAGYFIKWK